eukprot:403373609
MESNNASSQIDTLFDRSYVSEKRKDLWFKGQDINEEQAVQLAKDQFKNIVIDHLSSQSRKSIPKKIHFIWLGEKEKPEYFKVHVYGSWTSKDTYSEIITWGEKDISELDLINREIIEDKTLNPAFRADALRLEILYQEGGAYLDTDMSGIYSLNDLLDYPTDFIIGLSNTKAFELNNAFIASCPGHPLLKHLMETLKLNYQNHLKHVADKNKINQLLSQQQGIQLEDIPYQKLNIIAVSGPGFMTQQIFKYLNDNKDQESGKHILITPKQFFYPLSNEVREKLTALNFQQLVDEQFASEGKVMNSKDGVQIVNPRDSIELPIPILKHADLNTIVYGCHLWEASWQE